MDLFLAVRDLGVEIFETKGNKYLRTRQHAILKVQALWEFLTKARQKTVEISLDATTSKLGIGPFLTTRMRSLAYVRNFL